MLRFIRSFSAEASRLLVGLVLTAASASKIISFRLFSLSLIRLAGVPERLGDPAAVIVIALELCSGILLLARRSIRSASICALVLFLSFTVVLSSAVMRGLDVPCQCFGSLGPKLPIREQGVLDLALAAAALYLVRKMSPGAGIGRSSLLSAGIPLVGAILWGSALILWPRVQEHTPGEIPGPPETRYPAVMLLADFDDFGCQLCLDDFLAFCDSLNGNGIRSIASVRLIARRDRARSVADQYRMLEGWAAGNRYEFPISVDSDSLFEHSGAEKTSAIVWGSDGRLVEFAHFPLGVGKRVELLRALAD